MAWLIYIVSGLLSLGLIVHCIKTGRNTIWVYVLVVLITFPFVGSAIYFGAEILPELLKSRTSRRAMRGIRTTLDPEGNLRKYEIETASRPPQNPGIRHHMPRITRGIGGVEIILADVVCIDGGAQTVEVEQ